MTGATDELRSILDEVLELDREDDRRWEIIRDLHAREDRATFEAVAAVARSGRAEARAFACDVLGQLGHPARDESELLPFRDETIPVLLECARADAVALVEAAVVALGHQRLHGHETELVDLVTHPDADVRQALAFALGGEESDAAVNALVRLSEDADADVRDWATFALGTMSERTDAVIVEALARRLSDPDEDTRGEAVSGLAVRGDPRVASIVLERLSSGPWTATDLEAAAAYGDPAFLPALRECRKDVGDEDDSLGRLIDRAIAACEGR